MLGMSGFAGGLVPVAASLASAATSRDPARWPFSRRSPFNMPIGSGATYERVESPGFSVEAGGAVNCRKWSHPVYVGTSTDPVRNLYGAGDPATVYPVHIPAGAVPDGEVDGHCHFVDARHQYVYETYRCVIDEKGDFRSNTPVIRNDLKGDNLFDGWHGTRAYGGSAIAGLIRAGELEGGIRHALAVAVKRSAMNRNTPNGKGYVWPASCADNGWRTTYATTGNLHMGTLLAIPASVRIESIGVGTSGPAYEVAKALQDYGAYVTDACGSNVAFYVEPAAEAELGNLSGGLRRAVRHLEVVANNVPESVGGGGTPRRELAPPFAGEVAASRGRVKGRRSDGGAGPVEPASALPPRPTPEAQVDFAELLGARVEGALRGGRTLAFRAGAQRDEMHVVAVDDGGLSLRGTGIAFETRMSWDRLTFRDRYGLAAALAESGEALDHAIAAFYARTTGQDDAAREHLSRAGAYGQLVEAGFTTGSAVPPRER